MKHELADRRVAAKVKSLTLAANITQAALAGALHIDQASVSRKLSGGRPFRLDELDAVADILNTTPENLVSRQEA